MYQQYIEYMYGHALYMYGHAFILGILFPIICENNYIKCEKITVIICKTKLVSFHQQNLLFQNTD